MGSVDRHPLRSLPTPHLQVRDRERRRSGRTPAAGAGAGQEGPSAWHRLHPAPQLRAATSPRASRPAHLRALRAEASLRVSRGGADSRGARARGLGTAPRTGGCRVAARRSRSRRIAWGRRRRREEEAEGGGGGGRPGCDAPPGAARGDRAERDRPVERGLEGRRAGRESGAARGGVAESGGGTGGGGGESGRRASAEWGEQCPNGSGFELLPTPPPDLGATEHLSLAVAPAGLPQIPCERL